ncbi:MAG: hypothetical protein GY811_08850 [Myxococcales bacterium]|nr:hypothetical protein [Myxococcales bacterium]
MIAPRKRPLVTKRGQLSLEKKNECFVVIEALPGLNYEASLHALLRDYEAMIRKMHLSQDSEIYVRFYLSDISNQSASLRQKLMTRQAIRTLYSFVGQPPASGSKISLIAYHMRSDEIQKSREPDTALRVKHGQYQSVWATDRALEPGSSYEQTEAIFESMDQRSQVYDGSVRDNMLRTWCYVRDIDNNYQGFVDAREVYFRSIGLNIDTHYIASTGIEGCNEAIGEMVSVDSLAMFGIEEEQVEYMEALEHLCPTHDYNVSFERATRIIFGDRSHYYISGTASIDKHGEVVHVGNVIRQAERTIENIDALLTPYGAQLDDLCCLTVYLRDIADYEAVNAYLESALPPTLPYVIVRGAVCRPKWLIEMEGIAISDTKNTNFAPFLPETES